MLPSNLVIKNMIEILERMKEDSEHESEKEVCNLTLINQGTIIMSHCKVCIQ